MARAPARTASAPRGQQLFLNTYGDKDLSLLAGPPSRAAQLSLVKGGRPTLMGDGPGDAPSLRGTPHGRR